MAEILDELTSQAVLAVHALKENCEQKGDKLLFPDLNGNILVLTKYKKIPLNIETARRILISLPFPDRNQENTSICLVLPDFDLSKKATKDPDVDKQAREWAERLREKHGLTSKHYTKIFTFKQLQREYSQFADRAKLANAYEQFAVDRSLLKKFSYFMGRHFQKTTKMLLPINAHRDFSAQLQKAYSTTQLKFTPLKDSFTIKIGNIGQSLCHLESNLRSILRIALEYCPGGPLNIRSCHVQFRQISLPVYVDFGSSNDVHLANNKLDGYKTERDECSTLPDGLMVNVRADGKVTTVDMETGNEVLYPTEQDEWEKSDDIKPLSSKTVQKMALRRKMKTALNVKKVRKNGSVTKPLKKAKTD